MTLVEGEDISSRRGAAPTGDIKDLGIDEDDVFVLDFGDESDLLIFVRSRCGGAAFGVGGCTGGAVGMDKGKDIGESVLGIGDSDMGGGIGEKVKYVGEILVSWGMGDPLASEESFPRLAAHTPREESADEG